MCRTWLRSLPILSRLARLLSRRRRQPLCPILGLDHLQLSTRFPLPANCNRPLLRQLLTFHRPEHTERRGEARGVTIRADHGDEAVVGEGLAGPHVEDVRVTLAVDLEALKPVAARGDSGIGEFDDHGL